MDNRKLRWHLAPQIEWTGNKDGAIPLSMVSDRLDECDRKESGKEVRH